MERQEYLDRVKAAARDLIDAARSMQNPPARHLTGADLAEANARRVNPDLTIFRVSASSGDGMRAWLDWIEAGLEAQRGKHGESVDALKARIAELERQLAAK